MNSFKTSPIVNSILGFAIAAVGLGTPTIGHAATVGGPASGMICPTGYTPSFNGSNLKCSKISEIKVDLACLDSQFPIKVVRVPAGGTPNGLDVCDKPGGVQVTSANDISNFNRGSDYVNAKQDDAQIATKAGNQRQAEATALGVSLGDVEVQIGTAVTDTTSGDSTDKSKVPLTFFTFAVRTGVLIGNQGPVGLPATANSTSAFVPKPLPR